MKADFQKISNQTDINSFVDFRVKANAFGFHWHYHPEIEICYVIKGSGHRMIGESIEDFSAGDLVLVGSNLPHCWITSDSFNESDEKMEVYVVQFDAEMVIKSDIVELRSIKTLLQLSKRGLKFNPGNSDKIIEGLMRLEQTNGLKKYLSLLSVLQLMCDRNLYSELCSSLYQPDLSKKHEKRITIVCDFIHQHYKEELSVDELAGIASMNTSSFCRFFKKALGKTVVTYITELRVSYACNQLINVDKTIYQIAFESGFNSIAHFNKQFKKLTGKTPKFYKKMALAI